MYPCLKWYLLIHTCCYIVTMTFNGNYLELTVITFITAEQAVSSLVMFTIDKCEDSYQKLHQAKRYKNA